MDKSKGHVIFADIYFRNCQSKMEGKKHSLQFNAIFHSYNITSFNQVFVKGNCTKAFG